ncbi:sperm-activating peptides family [Treponema primitia ZAS-2]|uniref:Sperm-activating peptides family n=1 Tax=Treponema primitia (strain ATCC BAA-887 / DSM 12427 / ZAS-2) TaxID=545694 RepID=F5YJK4_TREPZ|nr:hypothetical protein [Treponema primitia]AEF84430.1 sperm-activating peptides family [Treponema primitia ZAS-2]
MSGNIHMNRKTIKRRILFTLLPGIIFLASCAQPLANFSETGPGGTPGTVTIRLSLGTGLARTAVPTITPGFYVVRITNTLDTVTYGSGSGTSGIVSVSFSAPLDATVSLVNIIAEAYDEEYGLLLAQGKEESFPSSNLGDSPITVTLNLVDPGPGTGDISLTFRFEEPIDPDDAVAAVEAHLYPSYDPDGTPFTDEWTPYSKRFTLGNGISDPPSDDGYRQITFEAADVPTGNAALSLWFYRKDGSLIKVFDDLGVLVYKNLTTNKWIVDDALVSSFDLTAENFLSSDATLLMPTGIIVGSAFGTLSPAFNSGTYHYGGLTGTGSLTLGFTLGKAGQTYALEVNGTVLASPSVTHTGDVYSASITGLTLQFNKVTIIVSAPDQLHSSRYTLDYTNGSSPTTVYYVSPGGTGNGLSLASPLGSVQAAVTAIRTAYADIGDPWPGKSTVSIEPAVIIVSGEVTGTASTNGLVDISDTGLYDTLPPIILQGNPDNPGTLDADELNRVLYIKNANVRLGDSLTLTGGRHPDDNDDGGGVKVVNGTFTMSGGTISGNIAYWGSGVSLDSGTFTMTGGSITGNGDSSFEDSDAGGVGVFVGGTFKMSGGTISNNIMGQGKGGGVLVPFGGTFTMTGGTISGNKFLSESPSQGGGVYVENDDDFTISGGSISGNIAYYGSGVYLNSGIFTMSGGSISGNGDISFGGWGSGGVGVYVGGTFNMSGGTISNNIIQEGWGGGVRVGRVLVDDEWVGGTFNMTGGTISGNKVLGVASGKGGGGLYIQGGAQFIMSGGSIIGNRADEHGGGMFIDDGSKFSMKGGSISGNTTNGLGGGVMLLGLGEYTMEGGIISGNTSASGGGVHLHGDLQFTMDGGTISGNTASNDGGGVNVASGNGKFTMNGGSISGNTAGSGGGVRVNGAIEMSGSAKIVNNPVYLTSGHFVTVTETMDTDGGAVLDSEDTGPGTVLIKGAASPPYTTAHILIQSDVDKFSHVDTSKTLIFDSGSEEGKIQ